MNRIRNQEIKSTDNKKRYFKYLKYPEIPVDISDVYIITKIGERLDFLAYQYYNDSSLWWIISCSNAGLKQNSYYPPIGVQIRIPQDISRVISEFRILNER